MTRNGQKNKGEREEENDEEGREREDGEKDEKEIISLFALIKPLILSN